MTSGGSIGTDHALGAKLDARPWMLSETSSATLMAKSRWLAFLCFTLCGYALFGKGFAYLGVPPAYIGEIALFGGVVALIGDRNWREVFNVPAAMFLLLFCFWGAFRTLPSVSEYGMFALRDAVVWGYGAFAFLIFGYILAQPARLDTLIRWYPKFIPIFLLSAPIVWLVYRIFGESMTRWPWADVPIVLPASGDVLVHLSGILAFWVGGLAGRISAVQLLMLTFCMVLMGSFCRAGMLAFMAAYALCAVFNPRDRSIRGLATLLACGLFILAASGIHFRSWDREREVSFNQVMENLKSVIGVSHAADLDDTKQWRLEWWGEIYNYTVRGDYFWTGKGFGINLTEDDGFDTPGSEEAPLRSPHNGHMTVLARMGVPGLALWILTQLTWAVSVLRCYVHSRSAGDDRWSGLFLFLLAYWLAFMINIGFDVVLEGPHGGIWFWTIYGIGLAALWLYRYCPMVLDADTPTESTRAKTALSATGV